MNADEMVDRLAGRLSLRRRVLAVVALLGGLGVGVVVGSLWATEPDLPPRTGAAFAAIVLGGLAWAAYGVWALTRRTPLFARDRVIAAWMGLAAVGLVALPVAVVTVRRDEGGPAEGAVALVTVAALMAVAIVNLVRARAHRAALLHRKRELGG